MKDLVLYSRIYGSTRIVIFVIILVLFAPCGNMKNASVLTITNEKVSLLEVLSLTGDITIYGNKENVSLIREENVKKELWKLDRTSDEIFNSPYFYLKSNNNVYVAPKQLKVMVLSLVKQWITIN